LKGKTKQKNVNNQCLRIEEKNDYFLGQRQCHGRKLGARSGCRGWCLCKRRWCCEWPCSARVVFSLSGVYGTTLQGNRLYSSLHELI